jgi:hypothetical protein
MCDRFAAAAMMAGHPNESSPLGLRNLPFALQVGANDGSYGRNKVAASWGAKLSDLRDDDPKGYDHFVKIHEGKGHWMNLEDSIAVPWMAKRTRNRLPEKIVWKQDDVTHGRSYWVDLPGAEIKARQLIMISREGPQFNLDKADGIGTLCILLNVEMIDFAEPVSLIQVKLLSLTANHNQLSGLDLCPRQGDPITPPMGHIVLLPYNLFRQPIPCTFRHPGNSDTIFKVHPVTLPFMNFHKVIITFRIIIPKIG